MKHKITLDLLKEAIALQQLIDSMYTATFNLSQEMKLLNDSINKRLKDIEDGL